MFHVFNTYNIKYSYLFPEIKKIYYFCATTFIKFEKLKLVYFNNEVLPRSKGISKYTTHEYMIELFKANFVI